MLTEYTAVVKQQEGWWNCQEHTYEDIMESLRVILKEALEFNRKETCSIVSRS